MPPATSVGPGFQPAARLQPGALRLCSLLLFTTFAAANQIDRVVIVKVDGLPADFIHRFTADDPRKLPSIRKVFARNGVTFENFYVRGLSLSASSWSMLDTGRHLEIRGNVEYDRYTLRPYDYLNFFPFYMKYALGKRVDTTGVELLDELGIPLVSDRFQYQQRFQGPQLLQRGVRWEALPSTFKRAFTDRSPKQVFDEWQTGLSFSASWESGTEQGLIEKLKDPNVRYLDLFASAYDHLGHLTADRISQLRAIESIDAFIGRLWSAIEASPYPATTMLIMLSDHGMNSVDGVYGQGYNLVDWFTGGAGGSHHVLTNRHPMTEYKLRGLDPFVAEVITPSASSGYLAGQSAQYPTAMLDLDGNERASIGLRNNTLNKLHLLLDQITRKRLTGPQRKAVLWAFFELLEGARAEWQRHLETLSGELTTLDLRIADQARLVAAQPKKNWTKEEKNLGLDKESRRPAARLESWKADRRMYGEYAASMKRLLDLEPADFDPGKFKIDTLIPPKSLGLLNSVTDLQHYVTGLSQEGLVLAADGTLDLRRSFRELDYFAELTRLRVRNNVQSDVGARPVDFIAARIPRDQLALALPAEDRPDGEGIWLWRSPERQALILPRRRDGVVELRYLPIANLAGDDSGVRFDRADWSPGFPLELFEDPSLAIPAQSRAAWLDTWHTEREWFEAAHSTRYSNGIVGLAEQMLDLDDPHFSKPHRTRRRTDLLVFANDHWNFNVRGFNPGGNHGSFLRISTHSVLMFAGGAETGLPRGLNVETPYDSLSFAPTVLRLLDRPDPQLPGRLIRELLP